MRKPVLKLLLAILGTVIAYILLGSFGGSYFVEHGLHKALAGKDERSLVIDRIFFNPFTFSAQIEQLQLNDAIGQTVMRIDGAQLNFSAATLLERRMVLSNVLLEQAELFLEIAATSGQSPLEFFAKLLLADDARKAVPDIRIDRGSVHRGLVVFRENAAQNKRSTAAGVPFEATLSGVSMQIDHYQSRSKEPAGLELSATINQSSALGLSGQLIPLTGAMVTKVQLENLDLDRFQPLLNPSAVIGRLSGILNADGVFSRDFDDLRFSGELAVHQLDARAAMDNRSFLSAGELRLNHAEIRMWPLRASARFLELKQPYLELGWQQWMGTAGEVNGMPDLFEWMIGVFGPAPGMAKGNPARFPAWPPAIDAFAVSDGRVRLLNPDTVKPVYIDLKNFRGEIASRDDADIPASNRVVNLQMMADMYDSGHVSLASIVHLKAGQNTGASRLGSVPGKTSIRSVVGAIDLQQVDAARLTNDFTSFLGRNISSGMLNLDLGYHLKDNSLAVSSMVSIQDLLLAGRDGPGGAFDHSLELAVALLKEPSGLIRFELPLQKNGRNVAAALKAAMTGFISDVAARPFGLLANIAGASKTVLDFVDFEPGSAAITPAAEASLRALAVALSKRSALGIHASGGQARQADRTALAQQQMQLHVALAASTRPSGRREQTALNFSDPKVQVVLDEFASERLGKNELAQLKKSAFPGSDTGDTTDFSERDAYYVNVFEALVAREQVSESALRQLARFRTQSVIRLLEDLGVAADRLTFGGTLEAGDQPVSLEAFALTEPVTSSSLQSMTHDRQ